MTKFIGIICQNSDLARQLGAYLQATAGRDFNDKYDFTKAYVAAYHGETAENPSVYMASFSHPMKMIMAMLTGVPFEILDRPENKRKYVIDINTFEYKIGEPTVTANDIYFARNHYKNISGWITANDFVNYFADTVCKQFLGNDIWAKCEEITLNSAPPSDGIRVYSDVRTISEYNLIKKHDGLVIRIDTTAEKSKIFDEALNSVPVDVILNMNSTEDFNTMKILEIIYNITNQLNK